MTNKKQWNAAKLYFKRSETNNLYIHTKELEKEHRNKSEERGNNNKNRNKWTR